MTLSQIPTNNHEKYNFILYIISIVFLIIVSISSGAIYLLSGKNFSTPPSNLSPTPTISVSPTPGINRSQITFSVLNASGVSGAAAKVAGQIKNLGYENVTTGNTSGKHLPFEISLQSDLISVKDLLLNDLSTISDKVSYHGDSPVQKVGVQVILGQ